MPDQKIDQLDTYSAPADGDLLPVVDTAAGDNGTKKITWANIKAALKAYFDTLYPAGSGTSTGTNTGDQDISGLVPNTREVNGQPLSADVDIDLASLGGVPDTRTVNGHALSADVDVAKGDVGLGNVDNTSDATKNAAAVTLTNKRITKRVGTEASSATSTPDADAYDEWNVTALAAADAFAAPTGTPTDGQTLIIRIKDNGSSRALTWNSIYRASSDLALPATTVVSKTLYLGFRYNAADSKWDLLALLGNI